MSESSQAEFELIASDTVGGYFLSDVQTMKVNDSSTGSSPTLQDNSWTVSVIFYGNPRVSWASFGGFFERHDDSVRYARENVPDWL